mgnify:CR=1 FL=1
MQDLTQEAYTFYIILMYLLSYDYYADIFYLMARGPHYSSWLSIVVPYNIDHYHQACLYNPPKSSVPAFWYSK